jgi:hypothetical protein
MKSYTKKAENAVTILESALEETLDAFKSAY